MKRVFKKAISLLSAILLVSSFCVLGVPVYGATASDDGSASVTESASSSLSGVKYTRVIGTTEMNGLSKGTQHVSLFEMKTDKSTSKLVTWAKQNGSSGYTRATLTAIAQDYENNHKGWKIIAGINGDQYFTSNLTTFAPQSYYPMIIDYEHRFPISVTGINSDGYVGIKNNGTASGLLKPSAIKGIELEILDNDGNIQSRFDVSSVNEHPSAGKTTVWFSYLSASSSSTVVTQEVDAKYSLYAVKNAELSYMTNHESYSFNGIAGANTVFGRGRISEKTDSFTVGKGQFAVETDNQELISALRTGVRIRVQHYYESDEMNSIETALGYHSIQRTGGKDVSSAQTYDTNRYNRSIFGMKADGTYILMTTDRNGYSGTTHAESNAILKYFGVTEAYQQDGGGSAMAIFRNSSGGFDIVNESSDSGTTQRSVLSGVFFAVYDPDYTASSPVLDISSNDPNDYDIPSRTLSNKSPLMSGSDVAWVQAALFTLGYDIELDGNYGPATEAVVRRYQTDRWLDADGKVGPATRADILKQLRGYIIGDVDGSGVIDETDSILLSRYLIGWNVKINLDSADINRDGRINDWDSVILERYLAGWNIKIDS